MRALLTAIGLLLAGAAAQAAPLSGRYAVEGTGLNGKPYSGFATITAPSPIDCRISWEIGGSIGEGTCIRSLNFVSASYPSGSGVVLVLYRLAVDGTLKGDWVLTGQKGSGREELKPSK